MLTRGSDSFSYDSEGNRTQQTGPDSTHDYAWDQRNRLESVTVTDTTAPSRTVEYGYDPFYRRIFRSVDEHSDGSLDGVEYFIYDGDDVVLVISDTSDPGDPSSFDVELKAAYLHGPAVDQVFAEETGTGEVFWHLTDETLAPT